MTDGDYRLVQLGNGAWSVRSEHYAETFHPVVGPVAEASALYVEQLQLVERLRRTQDSFVIWDVGLGAGGNTLTALAATRHLPCPIQVISFDQSIEPLRFALEHASALEYLQGYESPVQQLLSNPASSLRFQDGEREVAWSILVDDFPTWIGRPEAEQVTKPHVVFFDAYSPATNPEMWTLPLFSRLCALLDRNRPCTLPTYSRSTMLRVTLLLAGFYVGTGHATGEKEETTLAANTLTLLERPLDRTWLRRTRRSTSAEPLDSPPYRQAALSAESWDRLERHPQFAQP